MTKNKDSSRGRGSLVLDGEAEHKLRNYLAVVITSCDLLRGESPPGMIQRDIDEIEIAARSALSILDDGIRAR